jgi:tRNA(fMet)-specific endonuclease VapC
MPQKFSLEVAVLPWKQETSIVCGKLRANLATIGKALSPLDMLIAAHALETDAVLVSSDRAFRHVPGLAVEDWTA